MAGPCKICGGLGSAFNPCKACGAGIGVNAAPKGTEPEQGAVLEQVTVSEPTKAELYERATELEIKGLSSMGKEELKAAIAEAEAARGGIV
jgi:hypothetical protein